MGALHPGDLRLLADAEQIDDRGLELAEGLLHQQRQRDDLACQPHPDTERALAAIDGVRKLTKRAGR